MNCTGRTLLVLGGVAVIGVAWAAPTVPLTAGSSTIHGAAAPAPVMMAAADIDPAGARPISLIVAGTAGPLREGTEPCFADRYPCEVYRFSLLREGPIEVELTWNAPPRALLVQLYWEGQGLAHEDVAPSRGPSRIHFLRPRMEAAEYALRIVSLDPTRRIPFVLTLKH